MQSSADLKTLNTEISSLIAPYGFGPLKLPPVCTAHDLVTVARVLALLNSQVLSACTTTFELCANNIAHFTGCSGISAQACDENLEQMELCASTLQKCVTQTQKAVNDLRSYLLSCA